MIQIPANIFAIMRDHCVHCIRFYLCQNENPTKHLLSFIHLVYAVLLICKAIHAENAYCRRRSTNINIPIIMFVRQYKTFACSAYVIYNVPERIDKTATSFSQLKKKERGKSWTEKKRTIRTLVLSLFLPHFVRLPIYPSLFLSSSLSVTFLLPCSLYMNT